jgi:Cu-processing system ATP-binding protein
MIRIEKLNKSFAKLDVLKDVNLQFGSGEVICLIGPNGSGKTTLIKCLLGLVLPDSGKILVNNADVKNDYHYRNLIGYMPQIANYPENMKVRELFAIVKDLRGHKEITDDELIDNFKLNEITGKNFGQLSGGYKQRVTGALAFLYHPEIMILDEPTASLDPLSSEIMRNKILKEKQKDKIIIISSHIASEVETLADRLIYILDGKIIINKTLKELKNGSQELKLGKTLTEILAPVLHNKKS